MMIEQVIKQQCHPEWLVILEHAITQMDCFYLKQLFEDPVWLPGIDRLFAAFSMPLSQVDYLLLGESPYPRKESANGFAFWDNAVEALWSAQGLSKRVNKATSLRNFIKMLLVARRDLLGKDTSQPAIAAVDKTRLIVNAAELFEGMMKKGIMLLNASLVYSEGNVPYHARQWRPFMDSVLAQLMRIRPDVQLILFGKIAAAISSHQLLIGLIAEHPYNVSFITNKSVLQFFQPLDLLSNENN